MFNARMPSTAAATISSSPGACLGRRVEEIAEQRESHLRIAIGEILHFDVLERVRHGVDATEQQRNDDGRSIALGDCALRSRAAGGARRNDERHDLMHDRDRRIEPPARAPATMRERANQTRGRLLGRERKGSGAISAASATRDRDRDARRNRTQPGCAQTPARAPASRACGAQPDATLECAPSVADRDSSRRATRAIVSRRRRRGARGVDRRRGDRRLVACRCLSRCARRRGGIDRASRESCVAYVPAGSSRSMASVALAVSTNAVQSMLATERRLAMEFAITSCVSASS